MVGDYFLQILGAENNGALYLNEIMCVYRKNATNSISEKESKDSKFLSSMTISSLDTLNKIDAFTNNKYNELFTIKKRQIVSGIIISLQHNFETKENIFNFYSNEISITDKILWYTIFKHSRVVKILKKIKKLPIIMEIYANITYHEI
jgi:hypothetical protein